MNRSTIGGICLLVVGMMIPHMVCGQTPGTTTFRVRTQDPADVDYNPENVMAIWVTTDTGVFVKTLKRQAGERIEYLYQWIANSNKNVTDAVTGATISTNETHNVTWDCRDTSGNIVSDGTYRIRVEFTTRNGSGPYTPTNYIEFAKGASPVTLNPADYDYTSSPYTGSPEFVNMQLVYTRSATPHDIAVSSITAPESVIAGNSVAIVATISNETSTDESGITYELRNTTTDTPVGSQTVTTLNGNSSTQKSINWNTTDLPLGEYELTATVSPVTGEGDVADNTRSVMIAVRNPRHRIATTQVMVAPRVAPLSTPDVTVTVTNSGDFAESFDVVLSDMTAGYIVATQAVASLAAGAYQDVVFPWNTAGLLQGVHHLKAQAGPISTEWNRDDNVAYAWTAIATGTVARALISLGSIWEYNDQGRDMHGANWKDSNYYSGLWGVGPAQLGYNNNPATLISYGDDSSNKYPCYYFRHTFTASAVPEALSAGLVRDDGAVVYINGREALRSNIADGPTLYDQFASGAVGGADETHVFPFTLDPTLVVPGINVVAVEMHQANGSSSDIGFDFELNASMPAWESQPDIAVIDVDLHDGMAGDIIAVDVPVENRGNMPETFTVSLNNLDGGGLIGSEDVLDLMPGGVEHTRFEWSTLGLMPGDYRIQGSISGVVGDINTGNDAAVSTGHVTIAEFRSDAAAVAGSIGGYCEDVAVAGDTAYIVAGSSLISLDITTLSNPTVLHCLHLTGLGRDLALSGSYAYVACGKDGVQVVDISSSTSLVHRLTFDTSGNANAVALSEAILCIADGARGLRVVDLDDPSNPSLDAVIRTGGAAHAVAVSGMTAYIADDKGILIVDISTPTAPATLGRVSGIGFGRAMVVSGTTLYVGDADGYLYVVDVSTPASASITGQVRLPGAIQDIALGASVLHAAVGLAGVSVVDVSTPASPTLSGTIPTADAATGLAWIGSKLCVSDGYAGMQILEPSTETPVIHGEFTDVSRSRASAVSGDYAFLASGNQGIRVYDVSAPSSAVFLGSSLAATNARDVALSGDMLCVADGQYGLALLDVTTPASPTLSGRYVSAILGSVRCVATASNKVVITDGRRVERVDVTTPATPVFTHSYDVPNYAYGIAWEGERVYLAAGRAGLAVLNAADLSEVTILPLPGIALDVAVSGDTAFVAAAGGGWHTIDITNPSAPVRVGSSSGTEDVLAVTVNSGRLHVANSVSTVSAFGVSQPLTPIELGVSGALARCMHLGGDAGVLLASEDQGGVALITAPENDIDSDGLDDDYEQQIVDADPGDDINSVEDVLGSDDFDRDGLSNWAEGIAGTSPTDDKSVFALISVDNTESVDDMVLRWHSIDGKRYTVLYSSDLEAGFTPLVTGVDAIAPINTYTTTVSTATGFYMIAVE